MVTRSIGFRRAALHLGGLWALAFAQPLLDLLGRNAEFFVARGSTTGDILLLAFGYVLLPPLIGAGVVWGAGAIRPELGWGVMLALVALIVAGLVLPPAGDAVGGSALAVPLALLVGAGAAALYARASGRALVRDGALPRAADRAAPVPRRLARPRPGVPECGRRRGRGAVALRGADRPRRARRAAAVHARRCGRADRRRAVPELRPARARVHLVPQRHHGQRLHRGGDPRAAHRRAAAGGRAADHARPPAQPVHAVRAQPRADGDRADHGGVPRAPLRRRPAGDERIGCESLESDLEVVVQQLLLPADLREGLPAVDRVWEGFETDPVPDSGEFVRGANLQARRARGARPRRPGGRLRARDRRARAAGLATAAGVPPLDAPAHAVALSARRPPVSDRRQGVPGAREQRARGRARNGRPTRGSSDTSCRPSTSTGCWDGCSTPCTPATCSTTR